MRDTLSGSSTEIKSVSVVGNYLPRLCGIAAFTSDLVESITARTGNTRCWAIAMNDKKDGYPYPGKVRFEINQDDQSGYRRAAEFLNINQVDIVCLQHEYGIFGGPAGGHILELVRNLRMPVVTTLHTVLAEPPNEHYRVMTHLAELSDKLVVMSRQAADILNTVYDVAREKIVYIPHGIPDMPFIDPSYYKDQFDMLGRNILLTFGLLSRNKGIQYALQALPKVLEKFPGLTYVILGKTHPNVLKSEGESYRAELEDLTERLGLSNHVEFQNRFVTQAELCEYLAATDLYITPYVGEAQITSGTLAYAMGTGKAVISTPYWYAEEMLAGGRGELVPFKDSGAMADSIIRLLENDAERHQMRIRAYNFSRRAVWKEVAGQYLKVFHEVKRERDHSPRLSLASNGQAPKNLNILELPPIKIDHLLMLTDDTGLLQHATYMTPNRNYGYCTDDNARALIVTALARRMPHADHAQLDGLYNRYLSFVLHAFEPGTGRFRNFMSYERQWTETAGSEDSHGRAIWALGLAISMEERSSQVQLSSMLFRQSLKAAESFRFPRAIAFSMIGLDAYLKIFPGDTEARRSFTLLAARLFRRLAENSADDWPWPEDTLTYANGKIPHALLLAGQRLQRDDLVLKGLSSLEWLLDVQTDAGHFVPVGNNGWYSRGGEKARFDQQPIEANAMIEAGIAALRISRDRQWMDRIMICFNWFLGRNDLTLPLYDEKTGGCHDGLESDGVNQNEGAESTLSWLLSLTSLHHMSVDKSGNEPNKVKTTKMTR